LQHAVGEDQVRRREWNAVVPFDVRPDLPGYVHAAVGIDAPGAVVDGRQLDREYWAEGIDLVLGHQAVVGDVLRVRRAAGSAAGSAAAGEAGARGRLRLDSD